MRRLLTGARLPRTSPGPLDELYVIKLPRHPANAG